MSANMQILQQKGAVWRPFVYLAGLMLCLSPIIGHAATGRIACPVPQTEPLTVTYVIDGDTLVLEDGRHVRLIGINTPEKDSGALATTARAQLQRWLAEADNQVRLAYGAERFDRYERTLAYVFSNQRDVGAALLRAGLAWFVVMPPNVGHVACYRADEIQARQAQRGLWQGGAVIPAAQLTRHSGFVLTRGTITNVSEPAGHIVLRLDDNLAVFIHRRERAKLTALPAEPTSLIGKQIEARGWLYDYRGVPNLRIMHPAMLNLALKQQGQNSK